VVSSSDNLPGVTGPVLSETVSTRQMSTSDLDEGSAAEDLWAEPSTIALGEGPLLPGSSDLLNSADDLAALKRAFQEFLDGLANLGQSLGGWLAHLEPVPGILMGLTTLVTLHEKTSADRQQV